MTGTNTYIGFQVRGSIFRPSFNENNKRNRVIERDKRTGEWHVHKGYEHTEYSENHWDNLDDNDRKILDKVLRAWQNKK